MTMTDFILTQGDAIYNSVRHADDYFDYNKLPRNLSVPGTDVILSCSFGCHQYGNVYCRLCSVCNKIILEV